MHALHNVLAFRVFERVFVLDILLPIICVALSFRLFICPKCTASEYLQIKILTQISMIY